MAAAERAPIWLCHTCGQIEAPQACLGVCIRPVQEFVRAKHYDELLEQLRIANRQAQELSGLIRRLAWVSPRCGQWDRTIQAFRDQALTLLKAL
jgi:hypothetical protein